MAEMLVRAAHVVDFAAVDRVSVLGPTLEYITSPDDRDAPLVVRGTIPPGASVPLHSHADPETFIPQSGVVEALSMDGEKGTWLPLLPGVVFHVPPHARHAFRNRSDRDAVMIIATTSRIGRFFREVGTRLARGAVPDRPTPDAIERFLEMAEDYGYWNGSREENARVGIQLA